MPMAPTIHLNGTDGEKLRAAYIDAWEALNIAIEKVSETAPNGRDYYVQGESAYQGARSEHDTRMDALRQVRRDLERITEGVVEQLDERRARRR